MLNTALVSEPRTPPMNGLLTRMRSGRLRDSTLTTVAPRAPSHAVHRGPAYTQLKSAIFTPSSGNLRACARESRVTVLLAPASGDTKPAEASGAVTVASP